MNDAARGGDAVLALGGNLGDPARTIGAALDGLGRRGVAVLSRSGLFRNPAWGPVPQPPYVNGCALVRTALGPEELLRVARAVEDELGRERTVRWGPRTIDIDIVDYAGERRDDDALTLPHPRFRERAFVLVPLREIAPDRVIAGHTVRDWAAKVDATGLIRL